MNSCVRSSNVEHGTAVEEGAPLDMGKRHPRHYYIPLRSAHLNFTLQWRTRPSETEHELHLSHREGSLHGRREPLCPRKHRVLCDF